LGIDRGRYKKVLVRASMAIAVLLVGLVAFFILELRRTQSEVGTVVSAFLSDEVLHDAQDLGSGHNIQIIVLRESQQPGTWRARWGVFPQASIIIRSSFVLSNAVRTDIRAELRLPKGADSVIVSRSELEHGQIGEFQQRFPNNVGYFAISLPGFNFNKTEAILYVDHHCGGLCGGGGYILMRKVNGIWHVVDEHFTRMS
jgi:hypothetical protein